MKKNATKRSQKPWTLLLTFFSESIMLEGRNKGPLAELEMGWQSELWISWHLLVWGLTFWILEHNYMWFLKRASNKANHLRNVLRDISLRELCFSPWRPEYTFKEMFLWVVGILNSTKDSNPVHSNFSWLMVSKLPQMFLIYNSLK